MRAKMKTEHNKSDILLFNENSVVENEKEFSKSRSSYF
ncbi:hypothetical protein LEP1GSC036_3429 [Leptospira weilii str. 2006001853]|uniref:Uncharacterized protein n=2 Tax=Leptospira weilii TaxID=28184 RepID=A0A828Z1S5_9LEPT|nr:hypothetical protein LEP1GSC036_3429 [Leptospira weilii str. 2006001853]EMM71426.1 hypothetical protein LEP1GSC038_1364 [Leptospira weilii str. 2006001855]